MKSWVLEVDGIQKKYGDKVILSDIYLKCETSEVVGLLGRNGSGKSTLLKIISGIVTSPDKCIRINSVSQKADNSGLNDISYLSQHSFIPNHLSVHKAVSLSIDKQNRANFNKDPHIQSILGKKIKHLSGGELRYLEVKLVLFNSSKFVLLDEPFNKLSPLACDLVLELIKENSKQKGIIITDHNYENVIRIAARLVLLENGKIHSVKEKASTINK